MYTKNFNDWNVLKQRINEKQKKVSVRSGEIRWIVFGINIGSEIDGKGHSFTRPGLIINTVGHNIALVVPMSTKVKDIAGYVSFEWKEKMVSLCIHQMRIVSQQRILHRLGRISESKLGKYKNEIKKFYGL